MTHKRTLIISLSVALGMFAFGFAMVPLYNVMCKQLGINGKTGGPATDKIVAIDYSRTVTVEFTTTINGRFPWQFYSKTHSIEVHPGENKKILFYAENTTDHPMWVQAIPSVTPGLAAKHFKKIECFCFVKQTLGAHEHRDMPLVFHLDPALPKKTKTVTLSYTLFDITKSVS